ncbi:hypothetical protein [Streptomyces sp. NPDC058758]|uniref:hypothetical protein n=1 Tax=Streptomyces sp. NPDC058758 TaxID=3346627 RepID=UPI0036B8D0E9
MTDDTTRDLITRRLADDHQLLLHEAERIARALDSHISALKRNPDGATFAGDAVLIGTYLIQHAQAAAKLDAARDMARTLMGDKR